MLKKFLVFSDLHIEAGYNTGILNEICQAIRISKPDYIVCTGDIGEFKSLNKLIKDRGMYSTEEELIQVFNILDQTLFFTLCDIQQQCRIHKKKVYKPQVVFCLGNHDDGVEEQLAEYFLEKPFNIVVVPHRDTITLEGITFSHTFDLGISGKACTSASQILQQTLTRTVSGHSHVREIAEQRDSAGYKVFAIKMPCAHVDFPDWTVQGSRKWDRGYLTMTVDTDSDWYRYLFREIQHNGRRV